MLFEISFYYWKLANQAEIIVEIAACSEQSFVWVIMNDCCSGWVWNGFLCSKKYRDNTSEFCRTLYFRGARYLNTKDVTSAIGLVELLQNLIVKKVLMRGGMGDMVIQWGEKNYFYNFWVVERFCTFFLGPKLDSGNRWAWRLLEIATIWTKMSCIWDCSIMSHAGDEVEFYAGWKMHLWDAWDILPVQTMSLVRADNRWKGNNNLTTMYIRCSCKEIAITTTRKDRQLNKGCSPFSDTTPERQA